MVNAKNAIESLYSGKCDVYEYVKSKDSITKITKSAVEILKYSNIPCRLSFKNVTSADEAQGKRISQEIKLFLSNEIEIKSGSKIIVTQNGKTIAYKNAGESAVHSNHQEIILELFEGWT